MQAPPLAPPSRRASPYRRRTRDRTDPVSSTSATCSCRRPDAATTATTQTVAPPTAAAGPTPTRKHLDKFFFCFCFFLLISTWQDNGGHITAVIPTPSPACRPSPLARHHITAETSARRRRNDLVPPPPKSPRPNRHCLNRTPIPSPPPHPLPPCPLYHLAPPAAPPLLH